jgi:hypothetical protein
LKKKLFYICLQVVHKRLMAVLRHLIPGNRGHTGGGVIWFPTRDISTESLIVGALEAAFWEMVKLTFSYLNYLSKHLSFDCQVVWLSNLVTTKPQLKLKQK